MADPDKLWLSAFGEKLRPSLKPYCKLEKHLRLQKEDTGGWRLVLGHSIFDDQAIIDVWCDHYLTAKMTGARTVWFGVSWSDKAALARAFGPSLTRLKPDHVMGSRDATDSYNHVHLKKPKPFNSSLLDCWHKDRFYWFGRLTARPRDPVGDAALIRRITAFIRDTFAPDGTVAWSTLKPIVSPDLTKDQLADAIKSLKGPLGQKYETMSRVEQEHLRRYLFKNKRAADCCICRKRFPVGFLVAAHLKRRSECTRKERLDHEHIVAPMCIFGCDALYERGYIGVAGSKLVTALPRAKALDGPFKKHVDGLTGKRCSAWRKGTSGYFAWHLKKASELTP